MQLVGYLQFSLIGLCLISLIVLLIFMLKECDDAVDYDKIISYLNNQKELDLNTISHGNKEINKIEKEILKCKKVLHYKLFK